MYQCTLGPPKSSHHQAQGAGSLLQTEEKGVARGLRISLCLVVAIFRGSQSALIPTMLRRSQNWGIEPRRKNKLRSGLVWRRLPAPPPCMGQTQGGKTEGEKKTSYPAACLRPQELFRVTRRLHSLFWETRPLRSLFFSARLVLGLPLWGRSLAAV